MVHLSVLYTAHEGGILDTASSVTESSNRAIVRPATELLLQSLGEDGAIDEGIGRSFLCEFDIEIIRVKSIGLGIVSV